MSHGDRHPAADAIELERKLSAPRVVPLVQVLEEYLQRAYAEVWDEGHQEGKLDNMVGGGKRSHNPYS